MPTTNPVPSNDPTDLLFNAQKLDQVVSGSAQYYTDRLGVNRRTVEGISAAADVVLGGLGYAPPVTYASGISMTLTTQTVEYAGEVYAPKVANLPFTTSTWATDSAKFRLIQGVAATDLAASGGSSMIGYMPAGTGAVATTAQEKLRETVSILDFYANGVSGVKVDPTGVVDSTLGIQAALNYAASQYFSGDYQSGSFLPRPKLSRVIAPAGKYKFTSLTIPSGVDFIGEGSATIFVHQGGGLDGMVIDGTGSTKSRRQVIGKFTIKGIPGIGWNDTNYADMTVASLSRYGIFLNKADGQVTVTDVDIINFQRGTNNVWSVFSSFVRVRAYGCSEYGHFGTNGVNAASYEACTSYTAGKKGFFFDNTGAANNIYCLRISDCTAEYSGEEGFKAINTNVLIVSNWYSELNQVKNRDAGATGTIEAEVVIQSTSGRSDQFSIDGFFIMNTWKAVGYPSIINVGGIRVIGVDSFEVKNGKTFIDATGGINLFVDGNIGQGNVTNYLPQEVSGVHCLSINGAIVPYANVRSKRITLGPSSANFEQPAKYVVGYGSIRPSLERNGSTGGLFVNAEGGAIANSSTLFSVGNNGSIKFSVNGDGTPNINCPISTSAGAGTASALPSAPDGYAFIVVNGSGKYIPYYR